MLHQQDKICDAGRAEEIVKRVNNIAKEESQTMN
jgi:hypothetical protein